MAMVEPYERFTGTEQPDEPLRAAEERCLEAEQRCFRAERRRFEAERRREQVEVLLAEARRAGIKMEAIVAELKRLVAELRAPASSAPAPKLEPGSEQMADALSSAIARLRANVQAVGESSPTIVRALAASAPAPPALRLPHKHSSSWIARWRRRRKQRR